MGQPAKTGWPRTRAGCPKGGGIQLPTGGPFHGPSTIPVGATTPTRQTPVRQDPRPAHIHLTALARASGPAAGAATPASPNLAQKLREEERGPNRQQPDGRELGLGVPKGEQSVTDGRASPWAPHAPPGRKRAHAPDACQTRPVSCALLPGSPTNGSGTNHRRNGARVVETDSTRSTPPDLVPPRNPGLRLKRGGSLGQTRLVANSAWMPAHCIRSPTGAPPQGLPVLPLGATTLTRETSVKQGLCPARSKNPMRWGAVHMPPSRRTCVIRAP